MNAGSSFVSIVGPWSDLGISIVGMVILIALALAFSCYVKIATVLGIVRVGLGYSSLPSAFVTGALALSLTFFVMYPSLERASLRVDTTVGSKASGISNEAKFRALDEAASVWKDFILVHVSKSEVQHFAQLLSPQGKGTSRVANDAKPSVMPDEENSWRVLAPAFLVGELKAAFATGLMLFLPFLVVELLVAHVLVGLGAQNLSPAYVSFPFKLLLFVLADGWSLIAGNVVHTYLSGT